MGDFVSTEWDDESRTRQNRLILLMVLCMMVAAGLYLATSEPVVTDNGRLIDSTTTTEVDNE